MDKKRTSLRTFTRCLFADCLLPLPPFLSVFLLHITQAPSAFFIFLFPCTRYLSRTSRLLVSLLHHYTTRIRDLPLESARLIILLDLLLPKHLDYNLHAHLFKACFAPHENMHWVPSEFVCSSWR